MVDIKALKKHHLEFIVNRALGNVMDQDNEVSCLDSVSKIAESTRRRALLLLNSTVVNIAWPGLHTGPISITEGMSSRPIEHCHRHVQ